MTLNISLAVIAAIFGVAYLVRRRTRLKSED
jgi:hypothetical protein